MKNAMNILLLIAGIALVAIAVENLANAPSAPSEPKPSDGDMQIRQQGETFWTYRYVRTPGWKLDARFSSLAEAREAQKRAEELKREEVVVK